MKLQEIIEMLAEFGFEEAYVRRALAAGDSAFNAFEAVKTSLQLRWGDMCQELSVDEQKRLRPIYDRLMGITMKARTTKAGQRAEAKAKVRNIFHEMFEEGKKRRQQDLNEVFDLAAEYTVREQERKARKAAEKKKKAKKPTMHKGKPVIDAEYEEK
jgi:hypothetical protein